MDVNKSWKDSANQKQGVVDIFTRIVDDFDRKSGAFAGLKYYSPWILATEDWADRSGHAVEELREMISQKRISAFSRVPLDPRIVRIFEDFRSAAEEWRKESGYSDPATHLTPQMAKFPNYKEMKSHTWKLWCSIGLKNPSCEYYARDLSFSGFVQDRFFHSVAIRMTLKLGYGGAIWLDFRFPYGNDEPTSFGLAGLSGWALSRALRLPKLSELEWIAGKSKKNFNEIDGVLAITKAILTYLRATVH